MPSLSLQPAVGEEQVCVSVLHIIPQDPQFVVVPREVQTPPQQPWPAEQQEVPHALVPAVQAELQPVPAALHPVAGQVVVTAA